MQKGSLTPQEKLKEILEQKLSVVSGAAIVVNGVQEVVLINSDEAEGVLAKIKESAIPSDIFETVNKIKINETVQITFVEVPIEKISTVETAYQLLRLETEEYNTYIVKEGDSLWKVASDNNLEVGDLKQLNTELKSDVIKPGQRLSVISMEPKINVEVEGIEKRVEDIPFEVRYVNDNSIDAGATKIKQEGIKGKQEVTYFTKLLNGLIVEKNVIAKKELEEPVTKIILRGTRRVSDRKSVV